MSTIGDIIGFGNPNDEAIILFNEYSKRNEPMGKYRTFAVFPDKNGVAPEYGKSYYCRLRKDPKGSVYWATLEMEVSLESILALNNDVKKQLANLIIEECLDRKFKNDLSF